MAAYTKRGNSWKASVRCKGLTEYKTFPTKAAAVFWATTLESRASSGAAMGQLERTFRETLERYRDEISPTKDTATGEGHRINAILREKWVGLPLGELTTEHFTAYRDSRLKTISHITKRLIKPASVSRELTILSNVCTLATERWKWFITNPFTGCAHPGETPHRTRRPSADEVETLKFCMGYDPDAVPINVGPRCAAAFLFSIATAMREGEIAALRWGDVHLDKYYLHVRATEASAGKTQSAKRDVPLSLEAERILRQVKPGDPNDLVFGLSASQIESNFRKYVKNASIKDLHFHDARHEATTRLAQKLALPDLARVIGHKNLKTLMIYYNPTGEELAARLRQ